MRKTAGTGPAGDGHSRCSGSVSIMVDLGRQ